MLRSQGDWVKLTEQKGVFWIHDGHEDRPHALLTNGMHSGAFINGELFMEDTVLLDEASIDLMAMVRSLTSLFEIDRVIGPAMGAITLAHDLARHISLETGRLCRRGYVEKEVVGDQKKMVFNRTNIQPGERILMVEDVLTTGSSADLTATAIESCGGVVVPVMAVLFNRSGEHRVRGRSVVSLIDRPLPLFAPADCPLCKNGSKALVPKHNWLQLNAVY